MEVTRPPARNLNRVVKLPAIASAVVRRTRARIIGLYVMIILEKPEALLISGLRLGPPKKPHIDEVVVPKPVAVIPHQGRRMLTRAKTPAITPRKFTFGSFAFKVPSS